MELQVRYFAWLKQRTGTSSEMLDIPERVKNVSQLITFLSEKHPRFGEACEKKGVVRCAIDKEFCSRETNLGSAREVAFFPPITGG